MSLGFRLRIPFRVWVQWLGAYALQVTRKRRTLRFTIVGVPLADALQCARAVVRCCGSVGDAQAHDLTAELKFAALLLKMESFRSRLCRRHSF